MNALLLMCLMCFDGCLEEEFTCREMMESTLLVLEQISEEDPDLNNPNCRCPENPVCEALEEENESY